MGENGIYIKEADEKDFGGIIDCWKSVRGDNYYNSNIYTEDFIKSNKTFVALGENDEISAVVSITNRIFSFDNNVMSMLAVKNEYRGKGIATRLVDTAIGYLKEKASGSLKSHTVTYTDLVQNMLERRGFVPTGFLFGVRDNSKKPAKESSESEKSTFAVYTAANERKIIGELFIPDNVLEIAETVFRKLNLSFAVRGGDAPKGVSVINTFNDAHNKVFYIRVLKCGTDIGSILKMMADECDSIPCTSIILMINIKDSAAVYGYEEALKNKFMFSGFDLLDMDFDYILMYYGNNVKILFDEIKTTEESAELLDEILRC